MTRRAEHWNIVASVNEDEIKVFFEKFLKWRIIASNLNLEGGGIDHLAQFYNPFTDSLEIVPIECKHVEDDYISPSTLTEHIYKIKKQIMKFRSTSNKLKNISVNQQILGRVNRGIVFYRFENYSFEDLVNQFNKITIEKNRRHNPPIIYTIHNYQISRFAVLHQLIVNEINQLNIEYKAKWYHTLYKKNYGLNFYNSMSLNQIFSKFGIFILSNDSKDIVNLNELTDMIFYFYYFTDNPDLTTFKYIKSFLDKLPDKIKLNIVKYYFIGTSHYRKDNLINNMRNVGFTINEDNVILTGSVSDNNLMNFEVLFNE